MYRFGDVCVDLKRLVITRGGAQVEIEPKAFDVLRYLLEHADRLVTKDELLESVWRDTFVTPNVLTRAVAQLRRVLGDDAREARYIETVARRGYRFIALVSTDPLVAVSPASEASAEPAPPRANTRGIGARLAATVLLAAATGGVALLARLPARRDAAEVTAVPTRVTIGGGNNTAPAISPDGRAVAFVSDRTGSLEIYVVGLAPGSEEVAITHDGGQNMQPDWSPDGRWIAFHSRRRGGVWIVPSTGGTPQQVVDRGSSPAWSPDSERLVYTPDEGGLAGQQVLWTVKRDGSDRRQLTHLGQPAGGHNHPAWSHNGRFIAFAVSYGVAGRRDLDRRCRRRYAAAAHAGPLGEPPAVCTGRRRGRLDGKRRRVQRTHLPDWIRRGCRHGNRRGHRRDPVRERIAARPLRRGNGRSSLRQSERRTPISGRSIWTATARASAPARLTSDVVRNGQPDYSRDGRIAFSQLGSGLPMSVWAIDPRWVSPHPSRARRPRRRPELERRRDTRARETLGRHARRRLMVDRRRVAACDADGHRGRRRPQRAAVAGLAVDCVSRDRERRLDERLDTGTQRRTAPPRHSRSRSRFLSRVVAGRAMAGRRSEARRADAGGCRRQGRRSNRVADERSGPELAACLVA